MYRTIQDFVNDWAHESSLTSSVLSVLTDASLKQAVTPAKGRTIGALSWHLVSSVTGMLGAAACKFKVRDKLILSQAARKTSRIAIVK